MAKTHKKAQIGKSSGDPPIALTARSILPPPHKGIEGRDQLSQGLSLARHWLLTVNSTCLLPWYIGRPLWLFVVLLYSTVTIIAGHLLRSFPS